MSLFHYRKDNSPANLRSQIDRVFDNFFTEWPEMSEFQTNTNFLKPAIDVAETKEAFEIKAEIPDMKKEDIHLEVHGNALVLQGEKKFEKEDKKDKGYHLIERSYGSFRRAIPLPFEITSNEAVNASYSDGVLTINVAKPAEQIAGKSKVDIR